MTTTLSLLEPNFALSLLTSVIHIPLNSWVSWEISCKHGITISMVTSTLLHSLSLWFPHVIIKNLLPRSFATILPINHPLAYRVVVVVLNYINKIEERNVDRCFLYLAIEWMIRKLWFCYCSVVSHILPSPLRSRLIIFQAAFTEKVKCTTHECRTSTLQ